MSAPVGIGGRSIVLWFPAANVREPLIKLYISRTGRISVKFVMQQMIYRCISLSFLKYDTFYCEYTAQYVRVVMNFIIYHVYFVDFGNTLLN